MPRRPRGGGYSESCQSELVESRSRGGGARSRCSSGYGAGGYSESCPARSRNLGSQPDGQDLRSSGYGAAAILRRAIPSCDVQSAERTRLLGICRCGSCRNVIGLAEAAPAVTMPGPGRSGSCRSDSGHWPKQLLPKPSHNVWRDLRCKGFRGQSTDWCNRNLIRVIGL